MFTLPRSLRRPVLPAALLALLAVAGFTPRAAFAQSTDLATSYAIGLDHASKEPYNFTGRVFNVGDAIGIGSGTLIRRHTVLTAGHVVFDTTAGFITFGTFDRGLYEDYTFQKNQIISANALTGYQAAAIADTDTSTEAFALDMGYVIVQDAPIDGTWGSYLADPSQLSSADNQFFILGYPGVTFDGRTMAYLVPTVPYVAIGPAGSALYENDDYLPEQGESGGPVYIYNGSRQYVVAETLGGIADTSGEFNATFVRAIDKNANTFLTSAEYVTGLIAKAKIKGPRTVTHGTTVIYKVLPKFVVPNADGVGSPTTERYTELKLKTSTPGTSTQPAVTIKKLSYTEFAVTYDTSIRPKTTTTLTAYYSKTQAVPNSTVTITVD